MLFGAVCWQQAAVAAQSAAPTAHPAHAPHWSYEGAEDPAHWAALSPDFALCGTGHQQSPVDIVTTAATSAQGAAGFAAARFDHADVRDSTVDIVNNGHTIQVDTVGSGVLVIGRNRYVLQQFHFHIPSEHTVDGRPYPLEAHFVHKTARREARGRRPALRGRCGERGARNVLESAAEIGRAAGRPGSGGRRRPQRPARPTRRLSLRGFADDAPCSEGVEWLVLKEHATVSAAQIEAFRSIMHNDNRPTQPLAGRAVHTDVIH